MKVIFLIISVLFLLNVGIAQSQQCQKFVQQLVENFMNQSSVLLPSLMYSGITTNNPGQFYECQQQTNFSYYLVTIKNTTTNINSFTGICVPSICTKDDMKIALDFWNCEVYDFVDSSTNALMVIGLVVLFGWFAVLIVWSIILSCRQPEVNQYIKKQKQEERVSVNSLIDRGSQSVNNDHEQKGDFVRLHVFNYYEGYSRIFKKQKRKNLIGSFFFLAVLSVIISIEFSFKQNIASNPGKSYEFFNSFIGIFVTNTQIAFSFIMFMIGMKLAYGVYKFERFHQIGRFFFDNLLKKWIFFLIISLSMYGMLTWATDRPLSKFFELNFTQDCPSYIWQQWFLFRDFQLDGKVCLPWLYILQADIFLTLISAPFIIIFRLNKKLGYTLFVLMILVSKIISYAILQDQGIIFQPTKILNQQRQYSINYQTNTLVRAGPFYMGLMFAFFIIEGLEKVQGKNRTTQSKMAKKVRKQTYLNYGLPIVGAILMILSLSLIALYFDRSKSVQNKQSAYGYLMYSPLTFLIGFCMFVLPSFWQVEAGPAYWINKIFAWSGWNSLDKIAGCLLAFGPAVIGFTTFSSQNNIYFDLQTITVYLLGDLLICYIVALLACASIQNQLTFLFNWFGIKVFGKDNKYSVLLLQQ